MNEVWLPVPGYEGRYSVSHRGRMWSHWLDRPLRQAPNGRGYLQVVLQVKGRPRRPVAVHTLVLEAFVGPRPPGLVAMHLDGDSTNNALSNLAWGTQSENIRTAVAQGTHVAHNAFKTHCPYDHPYDEANTIVTTRGWRMCRACNRDRLRARYAREKESR